MQFKSDYMRGLQKDHEVLDNILTRYEGSIPPRDFIEGDYKLVHKIAEKYGGLAVHYPQIQRALALVDMQMKTINQKIISKSEKPFLRIAQSESTNSENITSNSSLNSPSNIFTSIPNEVHTEKTKDFSPIICPYATSHKSSFVKTIDEVVASENIGNLNTKILTKEQNSSPHDTMRQNIVPSFSGNLEDIADFMEYRGVLEERSNSKLMTLCYVGKVNFGLQGKAGSGKSYLLDNFIWLVGEELVYKCSLASPTALSYAAEDINKHRILYITELQKAAQSDNVVEIIKDLTEGKDSIRRVTTKKGVEEFMLRKGLQIFYTLADENNYKIDAELARRVVQLRTNDSDEAIEKRKELMLKRGIREDAIKYSPQQIRNHLNFARTEISTVKDLYYDLLMDILPTTNKTLAYMGHYRALVSASTKFHMNNRIKEGENLFTSLEDHKIVYELYYSRFMSTIEQLEHKEIELVVPDWNKHAENARLAMVEHYPDLANRWYADDIKKV